MQIRAVHMSVTLNKTDVTRVAPERVLQNTRAPEALSHAHEGRARVGRPPCTRGSCKGGPSTLLKRHDHKVHTAIKETSERKFTTKGSDEGRLLTRAPATAFFAYSVLSRVWPLLPAIHTLPT